MDIQNVKESIEALHEAHKTDNPSEYDLGILYGLEIALDQFND